MTVLSALGSFVVVVGLLTLTPGMDTALILRTAAAGGPRRAWGVVLGIQSGTLVWGVLTSAGVTALLTASRLAHDLLRWAGACYLIWLGLSMLWSARRPAEPSTSATPPPTSVAHPPTGGGMSISADTPRWRRGLLTNLLNPKMGAFYVALLPQFIPPGAPVFLFGVLLTVIHIVLGTAWSAVLVGLAHRFRVLLRRPAARRVVDRVTGTVITAFGARLALSSD